MKRAIKILSLFIFTLILIPIFIISAQNQSEIYLSSQIFDDSSNIIVTPKDEIISINTTKFQTDLYKITQDTSTPFLSICIQTHTYYYRDGNLYLLSVSPQKSHPYRENTTVYVVSIEKEALISTYEFNDLSISENLTFSVDNQGRFYFIDTSSPAFDLLIFDKDTLKSTYKHDSNMALSGISEDNILSLYDLQDQTLYTFKIPDELPEVLTSQAFESKNIEDAYLLNLKSNIYYSITGFAYNTENDTSINLYNYGPEPVITTIPTTDLLAVRYNNSYMRVYNTVTNQLVGNISFDADIKQAYCSDKFLYTLVKKDDEYIILSNRIETLYQLIDMEEPSIVSYSSFSNLYDVQASWENYSPRYSDLNIWEKTPVQNSTYDSGTIKSEVLNDGINFINQYRTLANENHIELEDDKMLQLSAEILALGNGTFNEDIFENYQISKPEMELIKDSIDSSFLYVLPKTSYPIVESLSNLINSDINFRNIIFSSGIKSLSFGIGEDSCGNFYILICPTISKNQEEKIYYSYPSSGFFPATNINNDTKWSIKLKDNIKTLTSTSITVTITDTQANSSTVLTQNDNLILDSSNTLLFNPAIDISSLTKPYTFKIRIDGLSSENAVPLSIVYDITFFDYWQKHSSILILENDFTEKGIINLEINSSTQLEYKILPENSKPVDVTFSSSKPKVVSVTSEGIITALSSGESVITVSISKEIKSTITINVPKIATSSTSSTAPSQIPSAIPSQIPSEINSDIPSPSTRKCDFKISQYSLNETINVIAHIPMSTSITHFKKNISCECGNIKIVNKNNVEITSGYIATGYSLIHTDSISEPQKYDLLVMGDINGTGALNTTDIKMLKEYIITQDGLSDLQLQASDVNRDGIVDILDLYEMQRHFKGKTTIQP